MLLSNGDIIVSGQGGGQLFWQQQDGILRQALLNTENDMKTEEKALDTGRSPNPANTPAVLTITPVPASQVLKMNDYKVILSSEPLPVSWQESGKKSNSSSSLPMIKPKLDQSSTVVIGKQPMTFTTISNVGVLASTQYPTFMIKDVKNSFPTNIVLSNTLMNQNSVPKKPIPKSVPKPAKVRKKPVSSRKIMLKPASSLLSQTALDRTNQDKFSESQKEKTDKEYKCSVSDSSTNNILVNVSAANPVLENSINVESSIINNQLPISTPKIIITGHDNSFSFSLGSKLTNSNLCVSNFTSKNGFPENLNCVKPIEPQISCEPSGVSVIGHSIADNGVIMTADGCINGEGETVCSDGSVLCETVLMDCSSEVTCGDDDGSPQVMIDTGVVVETSCTTENDVGTPMTIRSDDFHTGHVETILQSDDEHHTQEYTDNLLSQLQLSNSRVLPNMSSSQVSSVLNALVPSEKTDLSDINSITGAKRHKEPVKCEPTEFIKIESLQMPNTIKTMKPKAPEPKYRVCELNKHTCFRCVSCPFLSPRMESVEQHWATEHRHSRSELLDRQLTRRQIRCLGCSNIVYSKYALQIHLLCDHNVVTTEVHELIATTLAANKTLRDFKRPSTLKTSNIKSKDNVQQTEPNKELSANVQDTSPAIFQSGVASNTPAADFAMSEPAKEDDHKISEDNQIPPTPSFTLFSDIQLPNSKEETLSTDPPSEIDDSKKLLDSKKNARRMRRIARSKLRSQIGCNLKYNYRCMVERCAVRFSTADNLSYHLRCHRPNSDMLHCPKCDLSVTSWGTLASHLWRYHDVDLDLYCCPQCGYKCNSYSKLINNHIKIHSDERPFLCDICGKGFKTTKQLRNHKVKYILSKAVHRAKRKRSEEGGGWSSFTCNVCSRSFSDARILRHHTENVHNKLRPYVCTFCSHTASSKSSLRMHIRSHTGEKPFRCEECDYVTADHNSLRRHKMRHSGLRPYQCPHCSYNCIQATTYKAHLKNKHPGMDEGLMFSCPMCPFRTVKKDNYLAHKAEHDLGGDPRNRRKKLTLPLDEIQAHTLSLCKTVTHILPDHETVVLLEDSNDLSNVQGEIQLIVPEND